MPLATETTYVELGGLVPHMCLPSTGFLTLKARSRLWTSWLNSENSILSFFISCDLRPSVTLLPGAVMENMNDTFWRTLGVQRGRSDVVLRLGLRLVWMQ